MQIKLRPSLALLLQLASSPLAAHEWQPYASEMDREALRAHLLKEHLQHRATHPSTPPWGSKIELASGSSVQAATAAAASQKQAPETAKAFLPFARLDLRADDRFLHVGSNGLPDHSMMAGITAWQQQVPLPQSYFGENAWRLPLHPKPAAQPTLIKGRFLRGAIALAVNGIPIFNPQNNRGEISLEIGELDQWGGHCGRADDYHYHVVPLHLQSQAGKGMPVAYALDGYPIHGLAEPDGSPVTGLDECHGHEIAGSGYHYHASLKYPYVIGGFHGEVAEVNGQVDPQPRANAVRPALQPLRGATITGFERANDGSSKLTYTFDGEQRSISYAVRSDGTYPFTYDNGRAGTVTEVYRTGDNREGNKGKGKGKAKGRPAGNR